jgi:Tfp pilus assembly protein FimT
MIVGQRHDRDRGMSMVELCIVVGVALLLAAVAVPSVLNAVYNVRLRSAANDVAGLLQDAHLRAIRDNTYYPVCYAPSSTATRNATLFFIDTAARDCSSTWTNTYPTAQLPGNVTRPTSGYPDTTLSTMSLGFTPLATTLNPYFSARGTPCAMSGNVCLNITTGGTPTIASYQIFLSDTRPTGSSGWAAVTVSPAGRVKTWMWTGAAWQ